MSNYLVICPFHPSRIGKEDKHPSLNVDVEQNIFFCHGCGAKGSLEHYPELVALAQTDQGETRPFFVQPDYGIPPLGGQPREYLLARGYDEAILQRFEVGGDTDRVWLPVKLRDASIAGVVFRFLPGLGSEDRRYIYSYGFHKRNHVFGSYQFEPDGGTVCVVEGALDCIRMHQLGIKNTVSLLGDQPTAGQLDLLKQLGHIIALAFDNDEPGQEALKKVGSLLVHRGHEVYRLEYEGKDPGELTTTKSFVLEPFLEFLLERRNNESNVRQRG